MENMQEKKEIRNEKKEIPFFVQLLLVVALVLLLRVFVMGTIYVKGSSMEPNFYHGDFLFINKLSTSVGSPDYGDVVICRLHEDDTRENLIKRVIGLPGDEIDIVREGNEEDGEYFLYLNDELVEEDFINEPMRHDGNIEYPFVVPENSYFVMGDNRNASSDSRKRSIGAIPKEDLVGKVVFRLFPFDTMGVIR